MVEVTVYAAMSSSGSIMLLSKALTQHAQASQGQYGIAYLQPEPVAEAQAGLTCHTQWDGSHLQPTSGS